MDAVLSAWSETGMRIALGMRFFDGSFSDIFPAAPLPEALIASDPVRYVRSVMGGRHAGLAPFAPEVLAEYERCAAIAGTAESICEDYRASATIDLAHDRIDIAAGQRLVQPLRVLWGEHGAVGKAFDVLALWRERAADVSGRALPCGHYVPEEAPDELLAEALAFFSSPPHSDHPGHPGDTP